MAVHGLGGDWDRTWTGTTKKNWLRDFLPQQLQKEGVPARVMSFGYDSRTAFTKTVSDIEDVADMLLYRVRGMRESGTENSRPLICVAHSLGGIVVKKVRKRLVDLWRIDGSRYMTGDHSGTRALTRIRRSPSTCAWDCVHGSTSPRGRSGLLGYLRGQHPPIWSAGFQNESQFCGSIKTKLADICQYLATVRGTGSAVIDSDVL